MTETTPAPTGAAEQEEAARFVTEFGRALHVYGMPTHRMEEAMALCARRFGLEAQLFTLPTLILAAFGPTDRQHARILRVEPGEVNLEKRVLLDGVLDRVLRHRLDARSALAEVQGVVSLPPRFPQWLRVASSGLASAAGTRLLGGGAAEIAAGCAGGLVIGLLSAAMSGRRTASQLLDPLAGLVVTFGIVVAAQAFPLALTIAVVGSLIVLVPGLALTVAMTELATRHLVAGTARLMGALVTLLTIGLGSVIGHRVGTLLLGDVATAAPAALPLWTLALAVVLAPLALLVQFRARPRDAGLMIGGGIVAYGSMLWGGRLLGADLAAAAGALALGVASNLWARLRRRSAAPILTPGLVLLVPGSIGLQSVTFLASQDVLKGVATGFSMLLTAVSLAAGLLLANLVVAPRRAI